MPLVVLPSNDENNEQSNENNQTNNQTQDSQVNQSGQSNQTNSQTKSLVCVNHSIDDFIPIEFIDELPDNLKPLANIVYVAKLLAQRYQTDLTIVPINNTRAIVYGKIQTQPFTIDMLDLIRDEIELVQCNFPNASNNTSENNQTESNNTGATSSSQSSQTDNSNSSYGHSVILGDLPPADTNDTANQSDESDSNSNNGSVFFRP